MTIKHGLTSNEMHAYRAAFKENPTYEYWGFLMEQLRQTYAVRAIMYRHVIKE